MSAVTSKYPLADRYSNIHLAQSGGMVHVLANRIYSKRKGKTTLQNDWLTSTGSCLRI